MVAEGFVVFDLETTGFNASRTDRIVEIGVVHMNRLGEVTHRWDTLINPNRDLGPTRIHGIRGADVASAPLFEDISDDLRSLMANRVPVAHNAVFDTRFLEEEWKRARLAQGADFAVDALCTMQLASRLLPGTGRSLSDCCAAFDIRIERAHSALADADATAALLAQFLQMSETEPLWNTALQRGFDPAGIRLAGRRLDPVSRQASTSTAVSLEASTRRWDKIVSSLPESEDVTEAERNYLALLDRCLSDFEITTAELGELGLLASESGLDRKKRRELESAYFEQMVAVAAADGHICEDERHAIESLGHALGIGDQRVQTSLALRDRISQVGDDAGESTQAESVTIAPGSMVVLTGDMERPRSEWADRLVTAGFTVHPAVTKRVDLVVAEDLNSLSGKARKARSYGIPIISEKQMEQYLSAGQSPLPDASTPRPLDPALQAEPVIDADVASKVREEQLLREFASELPGSLKGIEHETLSVGGLSVIIFYRRELNYALVHNRVGILAGIGITAEEPHEGGGFSAQEGGARTLSRLTARLRSNRFNNDNVLTVAPIRIEPGQKHWIDQRTLNWDLNTDAFLSLDESVPESLDIDVDVEGHRMERTLNLRMLAHDQWTPRSVPETITAFVRPRSEAVGEVLSAAADLLEERTGDPSLAGYQLGSDRVIATAEAIYDSIKRLGIRYSEPPASFESEGQKVRTSDVVSSAKFGTCLDLAVFFAAALEEAGIQPFIMFPPGHALVGFAIKEIATESAIVDEGTITNLFGSKVFIPIETTAATAGKDLAFHDAADSGFEVSDFGRNVEFVVNVAASHRRIMPLPTIVRLDGVPTLVHVEEQKSTKQKYVDFSTSTPHSENTRLNLKTSDSPRRVQRWQSELLDLSLRNPLLKLAKNRGIKILLPEHDLPELEDRLAQNEPVELTPDNVVEPIDLEQGIRSAGEYSPTKLSRLFTEERRVFVKSSSGRALTKLTSLRREARSIQEETGANALYLSIGLLRWPLSGSGSMKKEALSPLFLLPVELTGNTSRPYSIRVEPNSELKPNHCLIEKIRIEHGVSLPQLIEPPSDHNGIDVERVFVELRHTFLELGLPFSIEPEARLAIIKFSSLDMWRDVSENWRALMGNRLVEHLVNNSGDLIDLRSASPSVSPEDEVSRFLPLPADGTQLEAIIASSEAESFVLEGPPGTGKSQTITNMIADGLARERTVLFVAEKQAALSVVFDRLKRVGLKPLVLNVHGNNQTVNSVREQLKSALQAKRTPNRALLDAKRERLKTIISALQKYPESVHSQAHHGDSVWESFQRCAVLEREYPAESQWDPEEVDVSPQLSTMESTTIEELSSALNSAVSQSRGRQLPEEWNLIGPVFDPRASTENPTKRSGTSTKQLVDSIRRLILAFEQLPEELRELMDRFSPKQLRLLRNWITDLDDQFAVIPSWLNFPTDTVDRAQAKLQALQDFKSRWWRFASSIAPGASNASADALLREYEESRRAGILSRKRLVRLSLEKILANFNVEYAAEVEQDPIRHLTQLREFQQSQHSIRQQLASVSGIQRGRPLFDSELEKELGANLDKARTFLRHATILRELLAAAPADIELIDHLGAHFHLSAIGERSNTLASRWTEFEEAWQGVVTAAAATQDSLNRWLAGSSLLQRISACLDRWGADLSDPASINTLERLFRRHALLERLRALGLQQAANDIDNGKSPQFFAEAAILAVSRHRLAVLMRESDLEVFDSAAHMRLVADYVRVSHDLREIVRTELPAQLLDRKKSFSASVGLRKQLDRKRGGSIRALFKDYGTEIMKITPVVLMSPSSVARSLPIDSVRFDTVVFDEASQVTVADAVGAIGRGEAVVIVGDSQQMPPSNTFNAGAPGDEDDNLAEDLSDASLNLLPRSHESESLLGSDDSDTMEDDSGITLATTVDQESILTEAVNSGLPRRWLQWHYRSQHDSLISFSNAKYYEGKLQVFPAPPESDPMLGVSARFVGGVYDRGKTRTNRAEADAVVAEIEKLISQDSNASIGVITFNTQQQDLILDLLEGSDSNEVRKSLERVDEPVFVKNLESVQGDERDAILFSVAFAKDQETGKLNQNFGPLNNAGGERRLNVAITRARKSVTLFTSLTSEDIDPGRTKSQGLIDLREYLAAAERQEAFAGTDLELQARHDEFRDQVAEELKAQGFEVVTDIGTSDFRVELAARGSAQSGWVAIILDSPEWAARRITSDRESLPTTILEGIMGWDGTALILLADWINDRTRVIDGLRVKLNSHARTEPANVTETILELPELSIREGKVVGGGEPEELNFDEELDQLLKSSAPAEGVDSSAEAAAEEPTNRVRSLSEPAGMPSPVTSSGADIVGSPASVRSEEVEFAQQEIDRSGEYEFIAADREQVGETVVLDNPKIASHRLLIQTALEEVIATEGPIETSRAARIVGNRFGLSRVSESRKRSILSLSQRRPVKDGVFGDYFWPDELSPDTYTGYRVSPDRTENRIVTEIGKVEIGNAMLSVMSQLQELDSENLIRQTMDIFGWTRKGKVILERLTAVLEWLTDSGRLETTPEGNVRMAK